MPSSSAGTRSTPDGVGLTTIIETAKKLEYEVRDFLVRAWKEAIYGNNDFESLLQSAIVTKKTVKT